MFRSAPAVRQQKVLYVEMLDTVLAHVKFIEGDDVFRVVVLDPFVSTEFSVCSFTGCKQVGDLDVGFFVSPRTDEIYLV